MKKGSFLFLVWILLSLSLVAYAEPPIEVIYWKASDIQTPNQDELNSLRDVMIDVQSFFASEMDRHGFGEKTFDFKDIKVVEGEQELNEYRRDLTSHRNIRKESDLIQWGLDNQIYVVFVGGASHLASGALGLSQQLCAVHPDQLIYCNNLVVISAEMTELILPVTAHEIGHAFSLGHSQQHFIENQVDVMNGDAFGFTPGVTRTLKEFSLSLNDAVFLNEGGRLSVQQDSKDLNQEIDADVNNDGYVDLYDVMIVKSGMQNSVPYDTDVNNDGVTDETDLAIVKLKAVEAIIAAAPRKRKLKLTTWSKLKTK